MKDLYKIHEIARLFRLHPDTLRYYEEKGLLHPVRGESGYRMYTCGNWTCPRRISGPIWSGAAWRKRCPCWTGRRLC